MNKKKTIIAVSIVFLILVAGFTLLWQHIYRKLPNTGKPTSVSDIFTYVTNPGKLFFRDKDHALILVMGLDYDWTNDNRPSSKAARTDTIFVLRLEKNGKVLNMVSIPRDSRVEISNGYYDKINAAFSLGYDPKTYDPANPWAGGIINAKEVIGNYLGVDFDHYILLKVQQVEKFVDSFGGVTVDVEKDMDYDDSWGHFSVHLKKGMQRLNGKEVIGYCRFRHDWEGDRGRMRRQQQFLGELLKELKKPCNLLKMNKIIAAAKNCIETDITPLELADMARVYRDFNLKTRRSATIDGADQNIGGISYIIPDEKKKTEIVRRLLLGENQTTPGEVKIQILNGCGVAGAAAKVQRLLNHAGFTVRDEDVDNAVKEDYTVTQVIDNYNNPGLANQIQQALNAGEVTQDREGGKDALYDFTIIVGKDLGAEKSK